MTQMLDLTAHDHLFAARTTPEDWARILKFRSLPNFIDGLRRHEGVMQPFFAHNFILNKVVTEVWRFQMLVLLLYLDATRDPGDPRTGLTLANLQRECGKLELASPGRISAYLNIMKVGGYLRSQRSELDSRVIHLRPTAFFMGIVEEWNSNIFDAIDAADPKGGLRALQADYPDLGLAMRTSGGEGVIAGWKALDPFPEAFHFASADGGWLLMEHIVAQSTRSRDGVTITPVSLNLSAASQQFGTSRTNLRRLLDSAYEMGLLDAPHHGGKNIVFSSLMTCSFITFIASFLSFFQDHTAIGLTRLQAEQFRS